MFDGHDQTDANPKDINHQHRSAEVAGLCHIAEMQTSWCKTYAQKSSARLFDGYHMM